MHPYVLKGTLVSLSSDLNEKFAPAIAELANDSTIAEAIGGHGFPHPYLTEDALNFFNMNRKAEKTEFAIDFIIFLSDKPVGIIGLKDIDHEDRKAHVGYWVGKEFRSRGAASEALSLVCRFSQHTLGIRRLYTKVLEDNPASMKVLLRNGFTIEGYERDSFFSNGKFHSMFLFARILE